MLVYISFSYKRLIDDRGLIKPDQQKYGALQPEDHHKSDSVPNTLNGWELKDRNHSQFPTQPEFVAQICAKAEHGDTEAQNKLGGLYATGHFVRRDDHEAVSWFSKAAEKGHVEAQLNLGVMFADGRGVEKSEETALKWYRRAADNGDVDAQLNLASRYELGRGVSKSDSEAFEWYRKAAKQGSASAQTRLGEMYLYGRGVAKDEKQADEWFRKAAGPAGSSIQPNPKVLADSQLRHLATDNRLASGSLLVDRFRDSSGKGKLTLDNGLAEDAYVKLIWNGKLAAAFYVRSHEQFTYSIIPDGTFSVIYCTGYGWDASVRNFARGRHARRYDDPISYATRRVRDDTGVTTYTDVVTLTLHKVVDGNAKTSDASLEEFDRY